MTSSEEVGKGTGKGTTTVTDTAETIKVDQRKTNQGKAKKS